MLKYILPDDKNVEVFSGLFSHWTSNKAPLENLTPALQAAEDEYLRNCLQGNFDYTTAVQEPAGITKKEMTYLYESHFRGGVGRDTYDELLETPNGNWKLCCYCMLRPGDTADHYKEKAEFPLLAVFPGNLLPACSSCNPKLRNVSKKFHGYYDNLENIRWFDAQIDWAGDENPPGIAFKVIQSFSNDPNLVARVSITFDKAHISKVWSSMLSTTISQIHRYFRETPSRQNRESYLEDLRINYLDTPFGPHQVVIDAVLQSKWLKLAPAR